MEKILESAFNVLHLNDEKRNLEATINAIKEQLYKDVLATGKDEVIFPVSQDQEIVVKVNRRITKPFNKDGMSAETGVPREELDYKGVAELVDSGTVLATTVAKYQGQNNCEFVTVRRRAAKLKKKKEGKPE